MAKYSRLPMLPLPLREKNLQCHNCNMRIYWSFGDDAYLHSGTKATRCDPQAELVAHPRIR